MWKVFHLQRPKELNLLIWLVKEIIIPYLGKGLEQICGSILSTVIERLDVDDFCKGSQKLCLNIAKLIIDGSTNVQITATALLLDSLTTPAAKEILLKNNYSEQRQQQVKQQKQAVDETKQRTATKKGLYVLS